MERRMRAMLCSSPGYDAIPLNPEHLRKNEPDAWRAAEQQPLENWDCPLATQTKAERDLRGAQNGCKLSHPLPSLFLFSRFHSTPTLQSFHLKYRPAMRDHNGAV